MPADGRRTRELAALRLPGCSPTAVFSILDAKTRIPPHTGVNNTRLMVHLPLIVPPGCGFRVGAEQREWEPGKASYSTIRWNTRHGTTANAAGRVDLDIWNPAVSAAERDMVRTAIAGVNDFYGFSMQQSV